MDEAATELGLAHKITWGGAWDRRLSDFGGERIAYEREVQEYRKRHPGPDFVDGPHFQMEV
jgi:peptidoglycan LD-endopeptidase CwlK